MDDLVRWLGEQLDEDERIARRAGDSFRQIGETGVIVATEGDRAEECASANWTGIAEHIVQHDPARVLREIDAKRRILRALENAEVSLRNTVPRREPHELMTGATNSLRAIVRTLAAVYADRPGYSEAWRP